MGKHYTFEYIEGQNKPTHTVVAEDDEEARKKIDNFIKQKPGRTKVPNSITMSERRRVPD